MFKYLMKTVFVKTNLKYIIYKNIFKILEVINRSELFACWNLSK